MGRRGGLGGARLSTGAAGEKVKAMSEAMEIIQHANIDEAFLAAQAEFPEIPKDRENPHFKSRYSTLDAIKTATRMPLNKHGILQTERTEQANGRLVVTAILRHAGSQTEMTNSASIDEAATVQGLGSQITYLRRYSLGPLLGICSDEDDDGNLGSQQTEPRRDQQRERSASPAAKQEAPKETPVEKAVNQWPTAVELATYLTEKVGKYPVKENAGYWKEIGLAVKNRLAVTTWVDPHKAIVNAVLDGVRAQIQPASAGSATPPATESKGDPAKAPSLERLAGWVDQMESASALADVVKSLESSAKFIDLRANPVAMHKAVVYALDKLNRHTDDQSWPFDECSKAGQEIIAIRDKYALDADSIEAFGGGPDSATPAENATSAG